jgi:radical SAM superfamily enzyme YgiQ (UPF0313 family)
MNGPRWTGSRLERALLHHLVLLLRKISLRGVEIPDPFQLWKEDAPVKIVWVQPGVFDSSRRSLIHRLSRGQPLLGGLKVNSLSYLASLTPDWAAQTMVDDNLSPIDYGMLVERGVNLAAITAMTQFAPRAYEIASDFRRLGIKTILGGPHATLCSEEAMKHVDTVVVGEAEEIWERILSDFREDKLKPLYRAPGFVSADKFLPPDPRVLPYHPFGIDSVQATRGCPHSCKFCCVTTLYGHELRKRPIENVLAQVKEIHDRGLSIYFTDDNIIGNRRYAEDLFKGLIELQKRSGKLLFWGAQSTVLLAYDEELLDLASLSGCRSLYIGFESLSAEALAKAKKRHNSPERYEEAIKAFKKRSIRVAASVMLGLSKEDKASSEAMFRLLLKNDVWLIYYYIFTPLPGTVLREELIQEGRLSNSDRWEFYDTLHVNFVPENGSGWTAADIEQTIWRYYDTFYQWRYILRRHLVNFGSELKPASDETISLRRAVRNTIGDMYFSLVSRMLVSHRLHPFETP